VEALVAGFPDAAEDGVDVDEQDDSSRPAITQINTARYLRTQNLLVSGADN
jgi:hypothetical protein